MTKLRINFGGADWQADLTVRQLEQIYYAASNNQEFLTIPLLLDGKPHSVIRVRPSQIRYYYEELDSPPKQ